MTAANYPNALARVLADEGGYSNDAGDPGGPTKYGITIGDVRQYINEHATADDVRALTVDQAKKIYAEQYWNVTRGNDEAAGLDYALFDYGVNSGVARAGKVVRRLCDLPTTDWRITTDVLTAMRKRDTKTLSDAVWDERLKFLQSLRTWSRFGGGWGSRCRRGKLASQKMVIGAPTQPSNEGARSRGKAQHPAPTGAKNVVKGAGAGGAIASGSVANWIGTHPFFSIAIALVVAAAAVYALNRISAWHEKRQTEPMPGTVPVPVKAGA
jgi:lysozyme family protein